MNEDLQYLLELSAVDKKVHELKLSKRDLPIRIENLKNEITKEKQRLDALIATVTETRKKIHDNQDLVTTEESALNDSNHRLNAISTNREYDAVHSEMGTHRKNIESAKANVTHFQAMLENSLKDQEEAEAAYKTVAEKNEPELAVLNVELGGIEDKITEQAKFGEEPRSKISKKLLSVYDRTVARRATPNVIGRVNMRNRACDVCSRTQSPQRVMETMKKNTIITCESCGSIMIWKDDDVG
jgi:predicted  nucleic acid-binding Zn-ribbon protein